MFRRSSAASRSPPDTFSGTFFFTRRTAWDCSSTSRLLSPSSTPKSPGRSRRDSGAATGSPSGKRGPPAAWGACSARPSARPSASPSWPGSTPTPTSRSTQVRFDIDLGVCVYCGYCVEVCPEDAIRMDTNILDVAAYSRNEMKLDIHELMNPTLRKPVGDCSLKFPHECRLHGGQMGGGERGRHGPRTGSSFALGLWGSEA